MAHMYTDSYLESAGKKEQVNISRDKYTDQATRDKASALLGKTSGGGASSGTGTGAVSQSSGAGAGANQGSGGSGILDPNTLTNEQLEAWAAENSKLWHTNPELRSRYEAENKAIKALLDKRNGTTSTFDSGTGKWTTTGGSAQQQPLAAQVPPQGQQSQYDLTEYLKQQKAAQVESALAGLKGAYEQSLAGYQSAGDRLRESYDAARNAAAAQDAIARRTFQEQAAASGLNSGTAGQAELSRSAALTGELARIGSTQAGAKAELELQKQNLQSQYETAIAQARQNGDSELATALYQELVRVQNLERQDKQLADSQALTAEQLAYNRDQTARQEAQGRVGAYLAAMGSLEGLDPALVAQSGYTQGELTTLADYYAGQLAAQNAQKPNLTAAQVNEALKNGILSPTVLSAYEYYYGVPYGGAGGGSTGTSAGGGKTPAGTTQGSPGATQGALDWENRDSYGSVPTTVTRDPIPGQAAGALDWENRDEYGTALDTVTRDPILTQRPGVSQDQLDTISGAAPSMGAQIMGPYARNLLNRILTNESVRRNASSLIQNALRAQNINNDEASYILAQLGY